LNPRLPPNQLLVAPGKWPPLGERQPRADDTLWTVSVDGLVSQAQTYTLAQLAGFPLVSTTVDIHCVTRWSRFDLPVTGVRLAEVLARAEPLPEARYVSFVARTDRRHSTSLTLDDALNLGTLLVFEAEGQPLEVVHGGPVRTIVPGRYFYKSLKWLERIELLAEDRLGTWEAGSGYHNHADPWLEERYIASNLDRRQVQQLLHEKNLSGMELLSLQAAGMPLDGLIAKKSLLRNANLRKSSLRSADFEGANLTNAQLHEADLRQANFKRADVEGADFSGSDLRGADFTGASLFGATFFQSGSEGTSPLLARFDAATRLDHAALSALSPDQARFVSDRLAAAGASATETAT
jgi:DMSO/TMAO reductase YedYZ molybdopterin-dependent catalytic subunit